MEPAPPKGKKSCTIALHEWFTDRSAVRLTNALPIQIFRIEQSIPIMTSHAIFFYRHEPKEYYW